MTSRISPQGLMICIVLLLLATGLVAVLGFHRTGHVIVVRLAENSRVVEAVDQVLAALEAQEMMLCDALVSEDAVFDSGVLAASLRAMRERAERSLEERSAVQDRQALDAVQAAWASYRDTVEELAVQETAGGAERLERDRFYRALTELSRLRRTILNLLVTKQADTAAAEETLRRVAFRFGLMIVFLTSLGMLVALGFHYRLSGLMIRPIAHIIRFVDNVGAGLFDQRLGTQRDHLINRLAQSCNRLTTNLQDAAEESRRRVRTERDTATVLIEMFEAPVLVVNDTGDPLLANAAARDVFAGDGGQTRMREFQDAVRSKTWSFSVGDQGYAIERIGGESGADTLSFAVRLKPASENQHSQSQDAEDRNRA